MANVQRIFVFVLFWFGFASSMKRIVCIYNFVTVAFFYIGVQLFPKLMIIKIVLIRIYIKKVFFIRYRYNYIYNIYIYTIYIDIYTIYIDIYTIYIDIYTIYIYICKL